MTRVLAALIPLTLVAAGCSQPASALDKPVAAPVAKRFANEGLGLKTAVFAGGCFWGTEAVFSHVKGVKSAVSGYHGGNAATAKYDLVSAGGTNHVEAVKVTYDPKVVRYDELVRIFFSVVADPTIRNRQGPDRGAQYNAELIPMNAEQRKVAEAYLKQMGQSGKWSAPIVTDVTTYRSFHKAEAYHQDFALKNPKHGYIVRWDAPKVAALKRLYPSHYSASFTKN
jgi:peptide-methionine (S)-S-oxide reductase